MHNSLNHLRSAALWIGLCNKIPDLKASRWTCRPRKGKKDVSAVRNISLIYVDLSWLLWTSIMFAWFWLFVVIWVVIQKTTPSGQLISWFFGLVIKFGAPSHWAWVRTLPSAMIDIIIYTYMAILCTPIHVICHTQPIRSIQRAIRQKRCRCFQSKTCTGRDMCHQKWTLKRPKQNNIYCIAQTISTHILLIFWY